MARDSRPLIRVEQRPANALVSELFSLPVKCPVIFMGTTTASGQFILQTVPEGRGVPYSHLLAKNVTIPLQALMWSSCATCLFQGWAGNTQRHHCTNKRKHADMHTYTHILADKHKNTLIQCHPRIRGCIHKYMCMYLYIYKKFVCLCSHMYLKHAPSGAIKTHRNTYPLVCVS